ncbi:ABC-2 type transporter [Gluconacetobacter diazotrophicus PA1 5]|uniref:ABC transporter permease n=2 Tax=Gluconacetobacter diazotrophicus TaxID=33996 RepID=A0A7W4FD00_GLUDI|nr:ABC transporter permease [Gluconacetobacter diazotrophicus]ACI52869.1 ABC-2 type transporter [Gluconacetobacter diazotrophicus PA1 5]MBB2155392.1 ABC transporter permease [Gluconacetobacter diazotrophicus]TWB08986.1 lipopolysaccharide transport system permease protein [Gluconacetobacter diazotrophicus]CAP57166.1 putative ABC transporter [Gluconacetobacter diazotrophicus PA1 5]
MPNNVYLRPALTDIVHSLSQWQISWLLGIGDIKQRYSRSKLGQFWITMSMVVFIVAIGVVYSFLFHQSIHDFLPYVACNYVVWNLISGGVMDSSTAFVQAQDYIRQTKIPRSVFALRVLVRNCIFFLHNFLIIPVVFIVMMHPVSWTVLLAIPGVMFIMGCGFFTCLSIGVICTRFRDLPQIVQSLMQLLMFVTPVMWPESSLAPQVRAMMAYNPFTAIMHMATEPLLGTVPSLQEYMVATLAFLLLMVGGLCIFARFRARIVYWL